MEYAVVHIKRVLAAGSYPGKNWRLACKGYARGTDRYLLYGQLQMETTVRSRRVRWKVRSPGRAVICSAPLRMQNSIRILIHTRKGSWNAILWVDFTNWLFSIKPHGRGCEFPPELDQRLLSSFFIMTGRAAVPLNELAGTSKLLGTQSPFRRKRL